MYAYLNLIFSICIFTKGPQDIPYSPVLFRLSIIVFALISFLFLQISVNSYQALLQVGAELIIMILFIGLLLSITNKLQRFMQTTCALMGTDALISIIGMPVFASLNSENINIIASFAILGLMIWSWLVTTHIVRNAINKSFSFAAGIVFLYIFSASQIMGILFTPISTAI